MEVNLSIVNELLHGKSNYKQWSITMRSYLRSRGLWEVVDKDQALSEREKEAALHAILFSCGSVAFSVIENTSSAREAWSALGAEYGAVEQKTDSEIKSSEIVEETKTEIQAPDIENALINETLSTAVESGNWEEAEKILDHHFEALRAQIPTIGMDLLFTAIINRHLHIVKKLVQRLTDEEMEMQSSNSSPLIQCISQCDLPMVKCLIGRHKKLTSLKFPDSFTIAVTFAVDSGCRELVPYIYSMTPIEDLILQGDGNMCAYLLARCFYDGLLDIAINMLVVAPELAVTADPFGVIPLGLLAASGVFSNNGSSLTFWQGCIYRCIYIPSWAINKNSLEIQKLSDNHSDKKDTNFEKALDCFCKAWRRWSDLLRWLFISIPLQLLGIYTIYELKLVHLKTLVILGHVFRFLEGTHGKKKLEEGTLKTAIMEAAADGNVKFINEVAKVKVESVYVFDVIREVILHAIQNRHPNVFNLIYGYPGKTLIVKWLDENMGNMLHKVAIIAPSIILNRIPGAALQMQRELQWFKTVQEISPEMATNTMEYMGEKLTPRQIFTKTHQDLVTEGMKWMKDMASSCVVVGALIITVTFAAAFTFPGGNEQNHGFPMFINNNLFRVFMILNALALSASMTSVLMFLGIQTARYAEEDFLTTLPKMLMVGMSTLILSMAAMLAAFCVGLSVMFHQELWIVIPSTLLVSTPLLLFASIQFPLLVEIFMSTYGRLFDKNAPSYA